MNAPNRDPVHVAVGIIIEEGHVLCCQRKKGARYGLQWEFPGGKIHPGETAQDCLKRELHEELDIHVEVIEPYARYIQTYADNGIFEVHYFLIIEYREKVKNKVFESIRWLPPDKFDTLDFLQGNKPLLDRLQKEYAGRADRTIF
jgi:8-oxo-dGTP diphosphatase